MDQLRLPVWVRGVPVDSAIERRALVGGDTDLGRALRVLPALDRDDLSAARDKTKYGLYADGMQELDWVVGELLGKLDELGIAEDTIVIFSTNRPCPCRSISASIRSSSTVRTTIAGDVRLKLHRFGARAILAVHRRPCRLRRRKHGVGRRSCRRRKGERWFGAFASV